ncbi:MAG: NADH-quinone oxidoreductase subunit J [Candidatus Velthaea sp.]
MIGFWLLAIALLGSAVFTITARQPVHSVVGLLANFVALAIMYLTLHAEFLAVIQIVVYSGAILILFIFVIALLSSGVKPFDVGPNRMPNVLWPAAALGAIAVATVVYALLRTGASVGANAPAVTGRTGEANAFGSVTDFGNALFTTNLLPFEITALILMVAVVGVVLLAGDDSPARPRSKGRSGTRESIVKREPIAR